MKKAMDGLDKTSDLYKTYAAQLKVLEDYQTSLNQNAVSGMQQAWAMLSQLDDSGVHAAPSRRRTSPVSWRSVHRPC